MGRIRVDRAGRRGRRSPSAPAAVWLLLALVAAACGGAAGEEPAGDAPADAQTEAGAQTPDGTPAADATAGEAAATEGGDVAQPADYPTDDIRWIVHYDAGGGFDTYSRGVAQVMENGFLPDGVNIGVENRTPIPQGITDLYSAEPDGYTIGMLGMPTAISLELQYTDIAPWTTSEFEVLGSVEENAYVIYVAADGPYSSYEDLAAASELTAMSNEPGTGSSLASLTAIRGLGLDAQQTYGGDGSGDLATALIRGDVDFTVNGTTDYLGFVEAGDVVPVLFLGTEDQRPEGYDWLADIPGVDDVGAEELAGVVTEMRLIVAPPGVPEDRLAYLRGVVQQVFDSQELADWAAGADRPLVPRGADEAAEAMQRQVEEMQELVPELIEAGLL